MSPSVWLRWLRPWGEARTLVLSLVVGAGAGVGAAVLIYGLKVAGRMTLHLATIPLLSGWWMFLTIPLGMFLAWVVTVVFAPEVAGHGVPQIIAALIVRGGYIRARVPFLKTIATWLTIGSGGSAGREGSIAQIGAGLL